VVIVVSLVVFFVVRSKTEPLSIIGAVLVNGIYTARSKTTIVVHFGKSISASDVKLVESETKLSKFDVLDGKLHIQSQSFNTCILSFENKTFRFIWLDDLRFTSYSPVYSYLQKSPTLEFVVRTNNRTEGDLKTTDLRNTQNISYGPFSIVDA
jgi:hypothetical protein